MPEALSLQTKHICCGNKKIEDEPEFKEKMNYMVFVLDYSAKARAAKKRRESDITQFFYNFDEGANWLLNKVSIEKKA